MRDFKHLTTRIKIATILITLLSGCVSAYSPSLFHKSAETGDIKTVTEFLNRKTDVNQKDPYGYTPLQYAANATHDNIDTVLLLIDSGADVNAKGSSGYNPLAMAAFRGKTDMAKLLIEKGADIDHAIKQLKANSANPHAQTGLKILYESGYFWLGAEYYRNQEYQKATNAFEQGIKINPTDVRNYIWLSGSYHAAGQSDAAITAAKSAIDLQSNNPDAYNYLGLAYGNKKQFKEALTAFKTAIEIDPARAHYRKNLGDLLFWKGDYTGAAEAYKKSVELAPNDTESLLGLTNVYKNMGQYEDALAYIHKLLEEQTFTGVGMKIIVENHYPVVNGLLPGPAKKIGVEVGDTIIRVDGKSTKGLQVEQIAQHLRGPAGTPVVITISRRGIDNPMEKRITRETFHGEYAASGFGIRSLIYRYKGNPDQAFTDAEKAYALNPADDPARISLGAAHLDRGNYSEAIKLLGQVKVSTPARILEATAYARQRDFKKAAAVFQTVTDEDGSFSASPPQREDLKALYKEFKPRVSELKKAAKAHEVRRDYKSALSALSEAIALADDIDGKTLQGDLLHLVRRMPAAPEIPEEARKHALRAEAMIASGEFEAAVKEFKTAITLAPYIAKLYFNTALLYADMKKYPEAIRNMNTYIEMAPDAPDIRTARDEIYKWEYLAGKDK